LVNSIVKTEKKPTTLSARIRKSMQRNKITIAATKVKNRAAKFCRAVYSCATHNPAKRRNKNHSMPAQ
jgi:hypothetical protein